MDKPKIILWDIETGFYHSKHFAFWGVNIPYEAIIRHAPVLCIAWKELGSNRTYAVDMFQEGELDCDRNVIEKMHSVLMDTDILIHHNGDKFDLKRFNAKVIEYGLPPLPPIVTIDTLKEVKKVAKFPSNRLDALGNHLIGKGKVDSRGLWDAVDDLKDLKAMKKMVYYCKEDVNLLEELYIKLRPYIRNHPNVARPERLECPSCGSHHMTISKTRIMKSGLRKIQYQCQDCGSYYTARNQTVGSPQSRT